MAEQDAQDSRAEIHDESANTSSKNILPRGMPLFDQKSASSKELSWDSRNMFRIGSFERPVAAMPVVEHHQPASKYSRHQHEIRIEGASDGFILSRSPLNRSRRDLENLKNDL